MGWSPPDGLERTRPREVRLRPAGHALVAAAVGLGLGALVAFAVLQGLVAAGARREARPLPAPVPFGAAGVLLAVAGAALASLAGQRRLLAEGRPAKGVVLRREASEHGTAYLYEFTTLGGRRHEARQATTRKLQPGQEVCVVYDPDEPGRSALYPFALVEPRERRPLTTSKRTPSRAAATSSS